MQRNSLLLQTTLILPLGALLSAQQPQQPNSICEVLANPDPYIGREIALSGVLFEGHHGASLFAWDCGKPLQIEGKNLPWSVDLHFTRDIEAPETPFYQLGHDVILNATGVLKFEPGQGHMNWAPASFTVTRIASVTSVPDPFLSVCEVLQDPARYNGATASVRGQFVPANTGFFLKAYGCQTAKAPPAIWIEGYRAPNENQSQGPTWRRSLAPDFLRTPVYLVTVRGLIEVHPHSPTSPNAFGEEGAFAIRIRPTYLRDVITEGKHPGNPFGFQPALSGLRRTPSGAPQPSK